MSVPATRLPAVDWSERAHRVIPGGCHTYAKGDDQYPESAPPAIVSGRGCRVLGADGREYVEYGMGLRSVTLGHAFRPVLDAVHAQLELGANFNRPTTIEIEYAEEFAAHFGCDRVKFAKDASTALDGAVKLARAATGRDLVALCGDHPFFSTGDWFIGTTPMPAGVPAAVRALSLKFPYGDLAALEALFAAHAGAIACVVLEPARSAAPDPAYLQGVAALCRREGAVFVLDETLTGFRWHLHGGQRMAGVQPDLAVFGKAMANGFACSALTGRAELMELGGVRHARERVFLLSTTHGGETHALAAGRATLRWYRAHPVVERLYERGAQLRVGVEGIVAELGLQGRFELTGPDCALLYGTRDAEGRPSQAFRTLFLQELLRGGLLAPSFVTSWSHMPADVDFTLGVVREALLVYRHALEVGVERLLEGRPVKPVFRPYA